MLPSYSQTFQTNQHEFCSTDFGWGRNRAIKPGLDFTEIFVASGKISEDILSESRGAYLYLESGNVLAKWRDVNDFPALSGTYNREEVLRPGDSLKLRPGSSVSILANVDSRILVLLYEDS
jgi:hypothetical protein